jgi:serine/threonine protein kinase
LLVLFFYFFLQKRKTMSAQSLEDVLFPAALDSSAAAAAAAAAAAPAGQSVTSCPLLAPLLDFEEDVELTLGAGPGDTAEAPRFDDAFVCVDCRPFDGSVTSCVRLCMLHSTNAECVAKSVVNCEESRYEVEVLRALCPNERILAPLAIFYESLQPGHPLRVPDTSEADDQAVQNVVITVTPRMLDDALALFDMHDHIPNAVIARVLFDGLSGLCFMHDCNLVHGDFKLENLLLDHRGRYMLIDFGFTRPIGTHPPRQHGTPGYNPPEILQSMLRAHKDATSLDIELQPSCDVFCAGVMALILSTRVLPFGWPKDKCTNSTKIVSDTVVHNTINMELDPCVPAALALRSQREPQTTPALTNLIHLMVHINPLERPSVRGLLAHTFFRLFGIQ